MSNFEIYAQSIDSASITVNTITEDTDFPLTNLQDRDENTLMKAGNANTSGYLQIDLGADRAIDYVILGNHNYTDTGKGIVISYCDDNDGTFATEVAPVGAVGPVVYHDYTSGDADRWFETFSSATKRYWRIYLEAMGAATNQEIGTIFMGAQWNWAHEPELTLSEGSGYNVTTNRAAGGSTFGQIANTTVRRVWNVPLKFISSSEKTLHETWRDTVFMDEGGGLSRYPYYFSQDNGTTLLFSRYQGKLNLRQHAYQQWETNHVFVEEL
jgi:hypothetical protein